MHVLRVSLAYVLVAFTGIAHAGITGTSHDLSGEAWNSSGELCQPCHTPHNADTLSISDVPLWNHETTTSTFTLYTSPTFDASTTIGQPNGASLACLSCHDGSVAVDSYSGLTGTTYLSGDVLLDTDLQNDHPIAFDYDAPLATADGELFDPTTTSSGLGSTVDDDMLFSGQMQCASCHDVHDDSNGSFLVVDNTASVLCLTCHDK